MSPMPPPKASTEGPRDRQVFHEMGQIVRALALAVSDGLVHTTDDGRFAAT